MFDYNIYIDNSTEIFKHTCESIEEAFPNAAKHTLLIDVDGSTIQIYTQDGKEIRVYDDYEVGAVYIESEIELNML